MRVIADITDSEKWSVRSSLDQRWGKDWVELHAVDVEARLDPGDRELTEYPAHYREQKDCHFVIIKTGESRYRTQFYSANREQFASGIHEYENLGDCVLNLLCLPAEHKLSKSGLRDS